MVQELLNDWNNNTNYLWVILVPPSHDKIKYPLVWDCFSTLSCCIATYTNKWSRRFTVSCWNNILTMYYEFAAVYSTANLSLQNNYIFHRNKQIIPVSTSLIWSDTGNCENSFQKLPTIMSFIIFNAKRNKWKSSVLFQILTNGRPINCNIEWIPLFCFWLSVCYFCI